MEKYINEETIIKNETYNSFPELLICQICQCLMLEPVMCIGCQNYYCKKCIEDWKKKSGKCPNRCENPTYKSVIEKNRLITKMKFKCIKGCGAEILFDDIKNHYNSNCLENLQINNQKNINEDKEDEKEDNYKPKIKILSTDEAANLKIKSKDLEYVTSKCIIIIIFFIVITLGDSEVGKTSLINT